MRVPGSRAIASRAARRWTSRSPRLEPRAMYATSAMTLALDGHFGPGERSGERDVRLPGRDAHPRHIADPERRLGRLAYQLLEVSHRRRRHDTSDRGVQVAVIQHRPVALPHPH